MTTFKISKNDTIEIDGFEYSMKQLSFRNGTSRIEYIGNPIPESVKNKRHSCRCNFGTPRSYSMPRFDKRIAPISEETANMMNDVMAMSKRNPIAFNIKFDKMLYQKLISGIWRLDTKSKTRHLTFEFHKRQITLVGKNIGNRISVGYSVYCDHVIDKRKNTTPKDAELSKQIALGRMEKKPCYSVEVSDEPHRFVDTALEVVKTKILKGEIIIKGIR